MAEDVEGRKGITREILIGLFVAIVGGLILWGITASVEKSRQISSAKAMFEKGMKYEAEGDYEQAQRDSKDIGGELGSSPAAEADYEQARQWYLKAVDAGSVEAMDHLGWFYEQEGVTQDYEQAHRWYLRAADAGHEHAMYDMSQLYLYGRGVAKDCQQAHQWYEKYLGSLRRPASESKPERLRDFDALCH